MEKAERSRFFAFRLGLRGILTAAGVVAAAATVVGFAERLWWGFDLFAHFRPQYALGLAVIALVLLFARRRKTSAAFVAFAVVNLLIILSGSVGPRTAAPPDAPRFKVVLANVYTANTDHDRLIDLLREESPDFAVLEEVNDRWLSAVESLRDLYPHVKARARADNFGIALLSRRPLLDVRIDETIAGVPAITAISEVEGRRVAVFALHTLPPSRARYWRLRNSMLDDAARQMSRLKISAVVAGDLNVAPWTLTFRRFLKTSGLKDSAVRRVPFGTWPTNIPPLRIPIDHCLHSGDLAVVERRRGPDIGSDHFPLVVEFAFAE
ncbi:MAG: endonuclease/exonuclease/phosphatase family protein [Planctomycetota bacterium]